MCSIVSEKMYRMFWASMVHAGGLGHSQPYFLRLHYFPLFEKEGVRGEFEVSFTFREGPNMWQPSFVDK